MMFIALYSAFASVVLCFCLSPFLKPPFVGDQIFI